MIKIKQRKIDNTEHVPGRASQPVDEDSQPPAFCFRNLQDNYGLRHCTRDEKAALADTLYRLGQFTWTELRANRNKHGLGAESIKRDAIKAAIPPVVTPDMRSFIVFRFSARAPMVGFRDRSTFHILWLDRSFTLYNHGS